MAGAASPLVREPEGDPNLPLSPSARLVERELGKVLSSRGFVRSDRMRRFLQFIVRQALEGRGAELKEYTIGLEVFDRPETFDPGADSIVRVEAHRLRSKLERYYQEEGRDAPVIIELEKGGYKPRFCAPAPPDGTQRTPDCRIVALAVLVLVSDSPAKVGEACP